MPKNRPFELTQEELEQRIEEMVTATIADLSSEFLLMPTGNGFIKYNDFQSAYEVLKRKTGGFKNLSAETVQAALLENSLALGVLRSVLGMTAPEWAELARVELQSDITQGAARNIDKDCGNVDYYLNLTRRNRQPKRWNASTHLSSCRSVHQERGSSRTGGLSPPPGEVRYNLRRGITGTCGK